MIREYSSGKSLTSYTEYLAFITLFNAPRSNYSTSVKALLDAKIKHLCRQKCGLIRNENYIQDVEKFCECDYSLKKLLTMNYGTYPYNVSCKQKKVKEGREEAMTNRITFCQNTLTIVLKIKSLFNVLTV